MDLQSSVPHEQLVAAVKDIVPILDSSSYKGQSGKVGVMGGCREYTGAPFFAATSSLRMGCDLAYVFCTPAAAPVIKGYSPELIVLPDLIDTEESSKLLAEGSRSALTGLYHLGGDCWSEGDTYLTKRFNDNIRPWLERLSVLIIGPGLGSDAWVGRCMCETVAAARELNLPLIIDGSGLNFVAETPAIVVGYSSCILTPNIAEFGRLAKAVGVELPGKIGVQWQQQSRELAAALGGPLLLSKGREDVITDGTQLLLVQADGSPRRCGGQGDVLTGTTAAFICWALAQRKQQQQEQQQQQQDAAASLTPLMLAAYGGCLTMRAAAALSYKQLGRSMLAEDMIKQLGDPVLQHAGLLPPDESEEEQAQTAKL